MLFEMKQVCVCVCLFVGVQTAVGGIRQAVCFVCFCKNNFKNF